MQLSMVYATLSYRLLVTNRGRDAVGPIAIGGDMIAAHRSLPVGEQLCPQHDTLPRLHQMGELAPGDTVTLAGQLRLPLAEIRAVRIGGAQCFLPLVRIALPQAGIGARLHVFTLGLPAERPDGALLALRMDRGFAFYRPLGQREIDTVQWLPLDAAGPAR